MRKTVYTNGIELSYLDHGGEGETLILLHGLSANAHYFDGLIAAGLNEGLHVLAVDLRGRGLSEKPNSGFTHADHARDIIGLMDALGLEQVFLCGHSYGGLLSQVIAVNYPDRVKKIIVMDAGYLEPNVVEVIMPSLQRLGQVYPSMADYLMQIKASPFYDNRFWDEGLEAYYRADMRELDDGRVTTRSDFDTIMAIAGASQKEDWDTIMAAVPKPVLLLQAPDGAGPGLPPILTDANAQRTADRIPDCTYVQVTGNHMTMNFGEHASKVVTAIKTFVWV